MNFRALLVLAVPALLACACTTADRISRNPDLFNSWPPVVQRLVQSGEIAPGFTPDQVRMALGNPDHVYTRTTADGTAEVWGYRSHKPRFTVGIGIGGGGGSTRVAGATTVSTGGPYADEVMRVMFSGGQVVGIEKAK